MTRQGENSGRLLPVLIAGFALLIGLLIASVLVAVDSMRSTEYGATHLVEEQRATARLIDDIQREENGLSAIFYSLAAGRGKANRSELLKQLETLEAAIRRTTQAGLNSGNRSLWTKVSEAAEDFIREGRATLQSGQPPSDGFYSSHEALINALSELAGSTFEAAALAEAREIQRSHDRIRYSLVLLGFAIGIAIGATWLTVRSVRNMFRRLQWQASELSHLSSRAMSDQEETARRFSREMHDEFGQTLSAIEANLVAMDHSREYNPGRMEDCLALLKDAIENMREVSQLLRPSILDDFGLKEGLRWLADTFKQRTGIVVTYQSNVTERYSDETETQLFRIAQEALTNVSKHSKATRVDIRLMRSQWNLTLTVSDNGHGLAKNARNDGLGLVGMRARARTVKGTLKVGAPREGTGVSIDVEVPIENQQHA